MGADESGVSVFTLAKSCMTITKLLRSREWKKIKSSDDCQHIMNNREKGTDGLTRVWGMARPTTWEMKRADSVRAASRNEKSICNNKIFWVFDGLWEACSKEAPEIRIPRYLLEFWCGTLIGYRCEPTRTESVTTQLMSPGLSPPEELAFAKQRSNSFFYFKARTLFGDGWRWIIGGTHGADWPWKGRNQTRWVLSDRIPVASCFTTHVERRAPYLVPALNRLFEQCLAKWLWLRPTTNRPF